RLRTPSMSLASLVKVKLDVGSNVAGSNEVQFLPKHIQFFLALLVENQLVERQGIAEGPHQVGEACAQESSLVFRWIQVIAATFGNVEGVREHCAEAGESSLVTRPLTSGNAEVRIV